jgi:hypothetical protein
MLPSTVAAFDAEASARGQGHHRGPDTVTRCFLSPASSTGRDRPAWHPHLFSFGLPSAPFLDPHWGFAHGFERYEPVYGAELVAASHRSADARAAIARATAAGEWARYDELRREQTEIDRELNAASERAVTSDGVTAAVTARLRELANGRRPWFLFAHFFDAHCDLVPPPPYDTRFDPDYAGAVTGSHCLPGGSIAVEDPTRPGGVVRRLSDRDLDHLLAFYEGEIAWVDAHVGAILDEPDALGLGARSA